MDEYLPLGIATAAVIGGAAYMYINGAGGAGKGTEVCLVSDLQPGEMKEVTVDGAKVLLVKTQAGDFYATSPKCTHYAAPLVKGTLQGDRVLCPWHGACFNVASGDVEDAPALDSLHTYPVTVEGGKVYVKGAGSITAGSGDGSTAAKRVPHMCSKRTASAGTFVILGGGAAGAIAAETLRQEGFEGRVVVVCQENHVPYDRVKLSKSLSVTAASITLRPAEFYKKHGIELMLGTTATGVDVAGRVVHTDKAGDLQFDKLLVATGGYARTIVQSPGHDLQGIFTLRVPEDANAINTAADAGAKSVVIVGSSFIGMEAAACLKQAKKIDRIVVVGMEKVPFERVLGGEIGAAMQRFHESKGIEFRMESVVKEFRGDGKGRVNAVEISSGEVLECDFCVVGAGIICGTEYLKQSGFETERDGSIIVDDRLRVAKGAAAESGSVFAAGDIARFPFCHANGDLIRIEHWDVAQQQGRIAARNMLGKDLPYETVPFFWTAQYGKSLRYAGNCMAPTEIVIKGSLDDLVFVAYYIAGGKVTAVATLGADPVAVAASELLRQGKMPSPASCKRNDDINYLATLTQPI